MSSKKNKNNATNMLPAKRLQQLREQRELEQQRFYMAGFARAQMWIAVDAKFPVMQRLHDFNMRLQNGDVSDEICIHCLFAATVGGKERADKWDREEAEWMLGQGHDVDPAVIFGFLDGVSDAVAEIEQAEAASN